MCEVPLIYYKLLTSHSDLTTYKADNISSVVPVREPEIKEAGNLPKLAILGFELRSPGVEHLFVFSPQYTYKYLLKSGIFTSLP